MGTHYAKSTRKVARSKSSAYFGITVDTGGRCAVVDLRYTPPRVVSEYMSRGKAFDEAQAMDDAVELAGYEPGDTPDPEKEAKHRDLVSQ
jgi:hypothetical protein